MLSILITKKIFNKKNIQLPGPDNFEKIKTLINKRGILLGVYRKRIVFFWAVYTSVVNPEILL
jgi:hypothetical protein